MNDKLAHMTFGTTDYALKSFLLFLTFCGSYKVCGGSFLGAVMKSIKILLGKSS